MGFNENRPFSEFFEKMRTVGFNKNVGYNKSEYGVWYCFVFSGKACEKCESGSYQEYFGAFACTECPSGSKLKYKGATSPKECQSTGKSKKQKYEVCEYQQMFSKETRQARDESSLDDINENFYDDESYAVSQPSIPSDSFEERFLLGLNMNSHQKRHSNNDVTELVHEKAALTSAPQAGGGETNSDYSENIKVLKRGYRDFQDKLLHVTKSSGQLKNFYKQLEIIENVLESTGEGLPVNRDSPLPSQLGAIFIFNVTQIFIEFNNFHSVISSIIFFRMSLILYRLNATVIIWYKSRYYE